LGIKSSRWEEITENENANPNEKNERDFEERNSKFRVSKPGAKWAKDHRPKGGETYKRHAMEGLGPDFFLRRRTVAFNMTAVGRET